MPFLDLWECQRVSSGMVQPCVQGASVSVFYGARDLLVLGHSGGPLARVQCTEGRDAGDRGRSVGAIVHPMIAR